MDRTALLKIEKQMNYLSLNDLLALIEIATRRIREKTWHVESNLESELDAMAADPQIQHELAQINKEFAITEMDGLEDTNGYSAW